MVTLRSKQRLSLRRRGRPACALRQKSTFARATEKPRPKNKSLAGGRGTQPSGVAT
jgi:hypothetical protein